MQIYHHADTYHDFGKPNDSRCSETNIVTTFLDTTTTTTSQQIHPSSVGQSSYEERVTRLMTDIPEHLEINKGVDEYFKENYIEPIGIIFDFAHGFRSSSYAPPPNPNAIHTQIPQGLYNINTIANMWDMANKKSRHQIDATIIDQDQELRVEPMHIYFGSHTVKEVLSERRNYIRIGSQKFDESLIRSKLFNLSVKVLCKTLKQCATNPTLDFEEHITKNWFNHQNFGKIYSLGGKQGVAIGNLVKMVMNAYDTYNSSEPHSQKKLINFIFGVKMNMNNYFLIFCNIF